MFHLLRLLLLENIMRFATRLKELQQLRHLLHPLRHLLHGLRHGNGVLQVLHWGLL